MWTAWALAAYRGVAADAFDVDYAMEQTGSASGGTSVTFTIPSQQMTSTGDELVLVVLSDAGFGTATWSAPPAMSPLVTNIKIGMFDGAADAAGPTGDLPVTVTPSNANGSRAGVWFVALRR